MTSDVGGRARTVRRLGWLRGDGRWRVRTVDPEMTEITVDLSVQHRLDVAENRLLGVQAKTEAVLLHLADRRRWAGKTLDEVLAEVKFELFVIHQIATGKASK